MAERVVSAALITRRSASAGASYGHSGRPTGLRRRSTRQFTPARHTTVGDCPDRGPARGAGRGRCSRNVEGISAVWIGAKRPPAMSMRSTSSAPDPAEVDNLVRRRYRKRWTASGNRPMIVVADIDKVDLWKARGADIVLVTAHQLFPMACGASPVGREVELPRELRSAIAGGTERLSTDVGGHHRGTRDLRPVGDRVFDHVDESVRAPASRHESISPISSSNAGNTTDAQSMSSWPRTLRSPPGR